jgi:cytochrome P450
MTNTATLTRDRPAHIPLDRVVDYDVYRGALPETETELHHGLFSLAEKYGRGIFWTPHNGGHWFINDFELLFEAARKPELFSSTAMTIPPVPVEPRLIPLFLDPPEHGLFRAPLMRQFTPGRILAMEAGIREFTNELIDAAILLRPWPSRCQSRYSCGSWGCRSTGCASFANGFSTCCHPTITGARAPMPTSLD